RFLDERIFGPLGMKDTAFFVSPAKIDRLTHAYRSQNDALAVSDEPATGKWSRGRGRCRVGIDRRRLSRVRAHVARRRPASGSDPADASVSQGDEDQSSDWVTASRRGNDSRPRPRLGLRTPFSVGPHRIIWLDRKVTAASGSATPPRI